MCESKECCGCEEDIRVLTKEDLVESAIDNISEGGCLGCTLSQIFDIGYSQGQKDTAMMFKTISENVLEEE